MQYQARFARSRSRSRGDARSGQILVIFVVVFALIAGAVAMMLDGGRVYWEKRMAQNAADAAAMAGGHELRRGSDLTTTEVVSWIKRDGQLHGFSAEEITVEYPPNRGSNNGDTNFVGVEVSRDVPLSFMRFFGWSKANVKAWATAGLQVGGDACMIALNNDPTRDSMKFNGGADFVADCGMMTNSTSPDAMRNVGGSNITASWIGVTGGYSGGGNTSPSPTTSVPPMLDPLSELPTPNPATMSAGSKSTNGGVTTWSPGVHQQIKITGGTHVFSPGEYYVQKGIQVTGGDVSGTDVFFYNASTQPSKGIDFGGNGLIQLSAPSTGTYKGVLFFGNRETANGGSGNKLLRGNANSYFQGSLYFPSQHLDWAGNPENSNKWALVIADTINISGTSNISLQGPPLSSAPPAYSAVLFE